LPPSSEEVVISLTPVFDLDEQGWNKIGTSKMAISLLEDGCCMSYTICHLIAGKLQEEPSEYGKESLREN